MLGGVVCYITPTAVTKFIRICIYGDNIRYQVHLEGGYNLMTTSKDLRPGKRGSTPIHLGGNVTDIYRP